MLCVPAKAVQLGDSALYKGQHTVEKDTRLLYTIFTRRALRLGVYLCTPLPASLIGTFLCQDCVLNGPLPHSCSTASVYAVFGQTPERKKGGTAGLVDVRLHRQYRERAGTQDDAGECVGQIRLVGGIEDEIDRVTGPAGLRILQVGPQVVRVIDFTAPAGRGALRPTRLSARPQVSVARARPPYARHL